MEKPSLSSLGATPEPGGIRFSVWSHHAASVELCLYDSKGDVETGRFAMHRDEYGVHSIFVAGAGTGARYGFRADGVYSPDHGLWFDPSKLLVDPYAKEIDRPFVHDARLSAYGIDTAHLVPKSIVTECPPVALEPPLFRPGGLIYEVAVKPFTILHPDIPQNMRGTVAALAHPVIIRHLKKLGVSAVELMPITAWIDERHLPALGLTNGWGYNPIGFMALDPRLVPGGVKELRGTVAALRAEGIGLILDLVFNHTGESDRHGATLSLRGLDNLTYYRHVPDEPGHLVNDTGTGNTLACDHPVVYDLVLDSLRHFVNAAGLDGFRFDLATILGRNGHGFSRDAALLQDMLADPVLKDRILIAEPWDIGPGGYQLGHFPAPFLEWNDRARDDIRMFWRRDSQKLGVLASALAGSSGFFSSHGMTATRSVNFITAHDGFTLMDLVSHARKHNEANGEDNRDGHDDNHSWNNGAEGETRDETVLAARRRDVMALLSTLFATRGSIMLTAGDEAGRSQRGNNNAYAQDNDITWVNWSLLDQEILKHAEALSRIRQRFDVFDTLDFFTGENGDVAWLRLDGTPMTVEDWDNPAGDTLTMVLATGDRKQNCTTRLAVIFNRDRTARIYSLPAREGASWIDLLTATIRTVGTVPARSVDFCVEIL